MGIIKTRSPIKDRPLRLPGQSVEQERRDLLDTEVEQPVLLAIFILATALLEWWRFFTNAKPSPVIFSFAAALTIVYAVARFWRSRARLAHLRQALDGERAVGQFLERLREKGFHVFHDVVGVGFNVDHVLVGPAGVFTIETKTWSKPVSGNPQITFDGETIRCGGLTPDRDPVIQAKAQAGWIKAMLVESTGKKFEVRPVIVFPGWFISNSEEAFRNVWVLEPKALPTFLDHEPERMSREDVKLASFHLSRLIRSGERSSRFSAPHR